jgi:hypothetical protein
MRYIRRCSSLLSIALSCAKKEYTVKGEYPIEIKIVALFFLTFERKELSQRIATQSTVPCGLFSAPGRKETPRRRQIESVNAISTVSTLVLIKNEKIECCYQSKCNDI